MISQVSTFFQRIELCLMSVAVQHWYCRKSQLRVRVGVRGLHADEVLKSMYEHGGRLSIHNGCQFILG